MKKKKKNHDITEETKENTFSIVIEIEFHSAHFFSFILNFFVQIVGRIKMKGGGGESIRR